MWQAGNVVRERGSRSPGWRPIPPGSDDLWQECCRFGQTRSYATTVVSINATDPAGKTWKNPSNAIGPPGDDYASFEADEGNPHVVGDEHVYSDWLRFGGFNLSEIPPDIADKDWTLIRSVTIRLWCKADGGDKAIVEHTAQLVLNGLPASDNLASGSWSPTQEIRTYGGTGFEMWPAGLFRADGFGFQIRVASGWLDPLFGFFPSFDSIAEVFACEIVVDWDVWRNMIYYIAIEAISDFNTVRWLKKPTHVLSELVVGEIPPLPAPQSVAYVMFFELPPDGILYVLTAYNPYTDRGACMKLTTKQETCITSPVIWAELGIWDSGSFTPSTSPTASGTVWFVSAATWWHLHSGTPLGERQGTVGLYLGHNILYGSLSHDDPSGSAGFIAYDISPDSFDGYFMGYAVGQNGSDGHTVKIGIVEDDDFVVTWAQHNDVRYDETGERVMDCPDMGCLGRQDEPDNPDSPYYPWPLNLHYEVNYWRKASQWNPPYDPCPSHYQLYGDLQRGQRFGFGDCWYTKDPSCPHAWYPVTAGICERLPIYQYISEMTYVWMFCTTDPITGYETLGMGLEQFHWAEDPSHTGPDCRHNHYTVPEVLSLNPFHAIYRFVNLSWCCREYGYPNGLCTSLITWDVEIEVTEG